MQEKRTSLRPCPNPVAYPRFPTRGEHPEVGELSYLFGQISQKNRIKIKEIGPSGKGARTPANATHSCKNHNPSNP